MNVDGVGGVGFCRPICLYRQASHLTHRLFSISKNDSTLMAYVQKQQELCKSEEMQLNVIYKQHERKWHISKPQPQITSNRVHLHVLHACTSVQGIKNRSVSLSIDSKYRSETVLVLM